VNIESVLEEVDSKVPDFLMSNIESIFLGEIPSLAEREMDAMYENGTIYIHSPTVVEDDDLVDDIIHEIAHSLEGSHALDIYGDGAIEKEFIAKRLKLYHLLEEEGIAVPSMLAFADPEYSEELDHFFYHAVGYPLLTSLTINIFLSPYAVTSLREYFANAFEKYFLGESGSVKILSPKVFDKIESILNSRKESNYGTI
tara:strand:+ start:3305 stop:3901 length:597 start_codon:yes stop_codon:yes gene_type:complete